MAEQSRSEMVSFSGNGDKLDGYLSRPAGSGPSAAVIVIQEWWGLVGHIKDVADRFAKEGFVALAPDLYHGAEAKEPDEAQKLMMAMDMDRASRELVKAADYLAGLPEVGARGVGSVGFCLGGGLAVSLGCDSARLKAVVSFYGGAPNPIEKLRNLEGPALLIYAEHDDFAGPAVREAVTGEMDRQGKPYEVEVYPGTHHAFFNDGRPQTFDPVASRDAWARTLKLFRENL